MKIKSRENCGSVVIDRNRNELGLSLMKRKKAGKIASRLNSLISSRSLEKGDIEVGFCFRRALLQNYLNFKRSSAPSRFLFFSNGCWVDFSESAFGCLKAGFVAGMPAVEVSVDDSPYLFDFFRMLQINLQTGSPRSIAWIDVDRRCFFPKAVVDGVVESSCEVRNFPKLKIDIKISGSGLDSLDKSLRVKAEPADSLEECIDESTSNNIGLPGSVELNMERPKWEDTQILKDGERDYQIVKNLFLAGMAFAASDATVTSISKCLHKGALQNARLRAFHSQMEITKTTRGDANLKFAWHGNSAQGAGSILAHGFGLPYKLPDSETYGVGVYLSPQNSSHSSAVLAAADENGERHVILCRVILGNVEKVEVGSQQVQPCTENFDVGVDDPVNPRWYIVWITHVNRHILPEYVVSYKSSHRLQGPGVAASPLRRAPAASSLSFQRLFSEMKNSLPSSKLEELNHQYGQYKAGKMTKDALIRKIRSIAGDRMVVSTIQRIRGH